MKIEDLAGVGAKSAPLFRELGIDTAHDLLDYLPFRYEDFRFPTPSTALGAAGGEENAVGHVVAVKERRVRDLEIVELRMRDEAGNSSRSGSDASVTSSAGFSEGMRLFVRGRAETHAARARSSTSAHYAQLGDGRGRTTARWCRSIARAKISRRARSPPSSSKNLPRLLALAGERSAAAGDRAQRMSFRNVARGLSRSACARNARRGASGARAIHLLRSSSCLRPPRKCAARNANANTTPTRCAFRPACSTSSQSALPFPLDRRAAARDREIWERHDARRADEPAAARRRRQRKNARRRGGRSCSRRATACSRR